MDITIIMPTHLQLLIISAAVLERGKVIPIWVRFLRRGKSNDESFKVPPLLEGVGVGLNEIVGGIAHHATLMEGEAIGVGEDVRELSNRQQHF